MDVDLIQREFPIASRLAFFQSSGISLIPKRTVNIMQNLRQKLRLDRDPEVLKNLDGLIKDCLTSGTKIMGCGLNEIAFTSSTTAGVNIFASSYPWKSGDNILLCDLEYPANVIPWYNQARLHNLEIKVVKSHEGEVPMESYQELIDKHTRVITVSHVQYLTGYRHDLSAISRLAHDHGAHVFVDGIQSLGVLCINVKQLEVDAFAVSGYKWLCSPMGTGLLYVRNGLIEKLSPTHLGMEGMEEKEREELWERILIGLPNLKQKDCAQLSPTAERFQYGMPNMIGAAGLRTSIDLLLELGLTNIENHIKEITTYLIKQLKEKHIPIITPEPWAKRAGIVTFKPGIPIPNKEAAEKINHQFKKAGVHLTIRGGYIRVACHFYNTMENIDRLLNLLPLK